MARILLGLGIWGMWDDDPTAPAVPAELLASFEMAARWSDHVTMAEAATRWPSGTAERRPDGGGGAVRAGRPSRGPGGRRGRPGVGAAPPRVARLERGDYDLARAMLEEALAISTRAGNERDVLGRRRDLADLMVEAGDPAGARSAMVRLVPEVVRMREPAMQVEVIGSLSEDARKLGT